MNTDRKKGLTLTSFDLVSMLASGAGLVWSVIAATRLGPVYARMFADLGYEPAAFTRLCLRPWFPIALALGVASVVGTGVALQPPEKARLVLMVATLVLTFALPAVFLVAMYLPIFAIADAIK